MLLNCMTELIWNSFSCRWLNSHQTTKWLLNSNYQTSSMYFKRQNEKKNASLINNAEKEKIFVYHRCSTLRVLNNKTQWGAWNNSKLLKHFHTKNRLCSRGFTETEFMPHYVNPHCCLHCWKWAVRWRF